MTGWRRLMPATTHYRRGCPYPIFECMYSITSYAFVEPVRILAASLGELQTACEALAILSALAIRKSLADRPP